MIINLNGKKITDDTTKISQADVFLLTERNKKYFKKNKQKIKLIKVPELIKSWNINKIKLIGVTGSNGKTSTATAIVYILNKLKYKTANQGTSGLFLNNKKIVDKNRTTPEILEILYNIKTVLEKGAKFFVMEVSSHAIAQNRTEGLTFDIKVHTNITSDHLKFHKTMEEYRRVKNSFFSDDSKKIINSDDKFVKYNTNNFIDYSWDKNNSNYKIKELNLDTPMIGRFNLYNLTAAIATVKALLPKISLMEIKKTLIDFRGMSGRMEVVSKEPLIIVDFAHTDDGMKNVLSTFKNQKISVLFGVGGEGDISIRPKMGAIAEKYANKIYLTSDNPRSEDPQKIIQQILFGIENTKKVIIEIDRKKAIRKAIDNLGKKEILLILGKGDETYQEINGKKVYSNDKEIVEQKLKINRNRI